MREIKFRGYRNLCKSGVMEYYFDLTAIPTNYLNTIQLMQYTGLKDKNGKEIYESDILRMQYQHSPTGIVEWIDSGFWVNDDGRNMMPNQEFREVIGNIYEDPELIK